MLDRQHPSLIFLISQPRAGSTLTQKILGSHSEILTLSEPWLMLHPLYAFKQGGFSAEYEAKPARAGIESFLAYLSPDGAKSSEQIYFESVANFYGDLYQKALDTSDKSIFLDKTPRYYNIIPELHSTFPQAKFILLIRNPLAVLCSMVSTWTQDRWFGLRRFKHDLMKAPSLLIEGMESLGEKAIVLHYEELVREPETVVENLCQKLSISYTPELINYGSKNTSNWKMGDKKSVHRMETPDARLSDRWISSLQSPQIWRFVSDYLDALGDETLEKLGYSFSDLRLLLDEKHPGKLRLINSIALSSALKEQDDFASWNYGYYPPLIKYSLQQKGFLETTARAIQKIVPL
ncbi:MAG: sulfotransferase [Cyanobacteria bacterium J06606_4]